MAPLPVWCEDPVERLALIRVKMGDLKGSEQTIGVGLLTEPADFTPPTITSQAARLQSRQRFFNLVVTNVPGPQFALYLLGRRLAAVYPMVPLAARQTLSIGLMSYDGGLYFGLTGDYDSMDNVDLLANDISASIDELTAATPPSASPPPSSHLPADRAQTRAAEV